MGFFHRTKAQIPPPPSVFDNTDASHKYSTTADEEAFFSALEAALTAARKSPEYDATRMANGVISVCDSKGVYLGKIKLQGRKTWMQYMTSLYNAEVAENEPVEEYIRLIKYWIRTTGRRV